MSDRRYARFVAADDGFRWRGRRQRYKQEGGAPFRDVTRQTLFQRPDLHGELRYFEVAPKRPLDARAARATSRGHGPARRAATCWSARGHPVGVFDLVTVPPSTWHQFRAAADGPLGFLCMVDAERDKPELPDARELERLRASAAAAAFLDATTRE